MESLRTKGDALEAQIRETQERHKKELEDMQVSGADGFRNMEGWHRDRNRQREQGKAPEIHRVTRATIGTGDPYPISWSL